MLEYSAFYPDSAALVQLAADRGVGVIAMRPLSGSGRTSVLRGLLADGYAGPLTPGKPGDSGELRTVERRQQERA